MPNCHSLALQESTSKTCDPKLCLSGQPIHFIGNQAIRFTIQVSSDPHTSREKPLHQAEDHAGESRCCPHHLPPEAAPVQGCSLTQAELGFHCHPVPHLLGDNITGGNGDKVPKEMGWAGKASRSLHTLSTNNRRRPPTASHQYLLSETTGVPTNSIVSGCSVVCVPWRLSDYLLLVAEDRSSGTTIRTSTVRFLYHWTRRGPPHRFSPNIAH